MTNPEYIGAKITNVRRGSGNRSKYVYARLESANGQLLISATLDYIIDALKERVDGCDMAPFDRQLGMLLIQGKLR